MACRHLKYIYCVTIFVWNQTKILFTRVSFCFLSSYLDLNRGIGFFLCASTIHDWQIYVNCGLKQAKNYVQIRKLYLFRRHIARYNAIDIVKWIALLRRSSTLANQTLNATSFGPVVSLDAIGRSVQLSISQEKIYFQLNDIQSMIKSRVLVLTISWSWVWKFVTRSKLVIYTKQWTIQTCHFTFAIDWSVLIQYYWIRDCAYLDLSVDSYNG